MAKNGPILGVKLRLTFLFNSHSKLMLLFGVTLAKMKNGNLSFLSVIYNRNCLVEWMYSIIPLFLFTVADVGDHW